MKFLKKTLGWQLNNPLNIRYNPANKWLGQLEPFNGFCQFEKISLGFRAAAKVICTYISKGHCNVLDIIYRFAPPTENDTESYYRHVRSATGYEGFQPIDTRERLCSLLSAMAYIESCCQISPFEINSIIPADITPKVPAYVLRKSHNHKK